MRARPRRCQINDDVAFMGFANYPQDQQCCISLYDSLHCSMIIAGHSWRIQHSLQKKEKNLVHKVRSDFFTRSAPIVHLLCTYCVPTVGTSLLSFSMVISIDRFTLISQNSPAPSRMEGQEKNTCRNRLPMRCSEAAETLLMTGLKRWQEAGLVMLAIVIRASAVLILQSHHVSRSTYEHGEIAANLLAGRGFSISFLGATGPTSQQAP